LLDQASKLWVLHGLELQARGVLTVAPMFDFVFTRNRGISYGLFQQDGDLGRWVLVGIKVVAVFVLWAWLARSRLRLTALALGLIIGGAIGNAVDRVAYGYVVDFILFHIDTAQGRFNWYVFNLADAAIVAGVAALLYESLFAAHAAKAP
jgi:signal peptidase II